MKPAWITDSVSSGKLLDYRKYLLYSNQGVLQPGLQFPVVNNNEETNTEIAGQNENINLIQSEISPDISEQSNKNSYKMKVVDMKNKSSENVCNTFCKAHSLIENVTCTTIDEPYNKNALELDTNPDKTKGCHIKATCEIRLNRNSKASTKTAADPTFLKEFYNNSRLHLISTLGSEYKQLVNQLREQSTGKFPGIHKFKTKGKYHLSYIDLSARLKNTTNNKLHKFVVFLILYGLDLFFLLCIFFFYINL